ncbi:MAG: hypothetical protein FJ090_04870 [Deltaproteobacteria bacterium]|nr:hypothetical protein [Deltaproteobacteria bacterium]
MKLLANADNRRFFLIPDQLALPPGDFELKSMTGDRSRVEADAVTPYEVPEAVAKAFAEQAVSSLGAQLVDMQVRLSEGMAKAEADLRRLTREAGLGDDPRRVLARAGVNPDASQEEQLRRLAEIAAKIGEQAPKIIENTLSAQEALGAIDTTLGGDTSGSVQAVLADLARPENSPELQAAARRLAELQRKLKED